MTKPKPRAKPKPMQKNWVVGVAVLLLIGAGAWLYYQMRSSSSSQSKAISCNTVSTLKDAAIDQTKSAKTGNVTITYTLTTTLDTGLNCFIFATVKDKDGVQVGTWRQSFLHSRPDTYHESQELTTIPYHAGETLTVAIVAAEGSTEFVD